MNYSIPDEIISIYKTIERNGFEVYLIGGCVRDLLLNLPIKDWDLTTNATPEQIQEIFPESYYENTFGTVGIELDSEDKSKGIAEITTYRTETGYENFRHPTNVSWGKSLQEDVKRRDFTINSIALKLDGKNQEIIDYTNGKEDLEAKLIRAVGNPDERFNEDALRMLRAIRFATQLNFIIENKTLEAIEKNYKLISNISHERIRDELMKIYRVTTHTKELCY